MQVQVGMSLWLRNEGCRRGATVCVVWGRCRLAGDNGYLRVRGGKRLQVGVQDGGRAAVCGCGMRMRGAVGRRGGGPALRPGTAPAGPPG